jgi:CRP-like cAMP-binding protein
MHVNGDAVSKLSFFAGLDPHFVSFVVSQMKPQTFSPNQWICVEGEVGMEMFFILDGSVQCVVGRDTVNEKTIATFASGHHFGEYVLLPHMRRAD